MRDPRSTFRRFDVSMLVALALNFTLATNANANWFQRMFGKDPVALEAAAQEAKKAAVEASLNMREVTNQFGALVGDLYGTDPARAARARAVFSGVLGRPVTSSEVPQVGFSVMVTAPTGESLPLRVDMWPAGDTQHKWVTTRVLADGSAAFIWRALNTTVQVPQSTETVRKRITDLASVIASHRVVEARACGHGTNPDGFTEVHVGSYDCMELKQYERMRELVLASLPANELAPSESAVKFSVSGGNFAALIAREGELKAIATKNPDAKVQGWVHDFSNPGKRTPSFEKVNWEVPISEWTKSCTDTTVDGVGRICYTFVDLRLQTIPEYFKYIEELRKRVNPGA